MKSLFSLLLFVSFSFSMAQTSKTPCSSIVYSDFDFWLGEWEVTNANGSKAGENSIKKIQGNCVLQENWTSATAGYTGTSHSFYNAATKQWEQLWIDNQGGSLHLKGEMKNDYQMVLQTDEAKNKDGNTFVHRVTWTNLKTGDVRQLWETITQEKNGENITVAFDGTYKRKEN